MPDFDIIGTNAYGASPGSFGQGLYQSLAAQQGGGVPQQGQGMVQQPGAPISGLVAGALGLPTTGGANPGMSYLAQGQAQQASGQAQQPQQQPQQMSPLMAGIIGAPQPGSLAGAATGTPQGGQPQRPNIGSAIGSGLRSLFDSVVYGAQSQDV